MANILILTFVPETKTGFAGWVWGALLMRLVFVQRFLSFLLARLKKMNFSIMELIHETPHVIYF